MAGFSFKLYRALMILALGIFIAALSLTVSPLSKVRLQDFAVSNGQIRQVRIVDHRSNRSTYHELWITTSIGESFYLRDPDRKPLDRYEAALQKAGAVSIRFRDDSDGHRIYDVRDAKQIFIPFDEIIAELNQKQKFGFLIAGGMTLLGSFLLWLEIRKPRPKLAK